MCVEARRQSISVGVGFLDIPRRFQGSNSEPQASSGSKRLHQLSHLEAPYWCLHLRTRDNWACWLMLVMGTWEAEAGRQLRLGPV